MILLNTQAPHDFTTGLKHKLPQQVKLFIRRYLVIEYSVRNQDRMIQSMEYSSDTWSHPMLLGQHRTWQRTVCTRVQRGVSLQLKTHTWCRGSNLVVLCKAECHHNAVGTEIYWTPFQLRMVEHTEQRFHWVVARIWNHQSVQSYLWMGIAQRWGGRVWLELISRLQPMVAATGELDKECKWVGMKLSPEYPLQDQPTQTNKR